MVSPDWPRSAFGAALVARYTAAFRLALAGVDSAGTDARRKLPPPESLRAPLISSAPRGCDGRDSN